MKLTHKLLICIVACFAMTSCTARYQQLLMDKDLEIRDLQGRIAELTANNTEIGDKHRSAEAALSQARAALAAAPKEAAATKNDLTSLQSEVGSEAQVRYRHGRISIGIDNTVTFASGSTELKKSATGTLSRVGNIIKSRFAGHRIYVEGHTDIDPIQKTKDRFRSNRHLSAERADAVASFLVRSAGLPERQVVVVGFGAADPADQGVGDSAKARNRRVEIVVGETL